MVNTVPSLGAVGGAALSYHMDVDKVAFTGSTITGRKIMEAAAKSNLKKVRDPAEAQAQRENIHFHAQVSLELGGKSPNIVFESADLEQGGSHRPGTGGSMVAVIDCASFCDSAATWAALGILYNTGKGPRR